MPAADDGGAVDFEFGSFLLAGVSLSNTPDMFGDSFARGGVITVSEMSTASSISTTADALLAGGMRRSKAVENNRALPTDRAYLAYNHFANAVRSEATGSVPSFAAGRSQDLDRFTFGLEKTFDDRNWSVEMRFPLAVENGTTFNNGGIVASTQGGNVGNLALLFKRGIRIDDTTIVAAGLGLEVPTGDDAHAATNSVSYVVENEAVYLSPFVSMMRADSDLWFCHGFAQLDIPLNGNSVRFETLPPGGAPTAGTAGVYTDQTLLYLDFGAGCWLAYNDYGDERTGVAAIAEFHYTSALNESDLVTAMPRTTPNTTALVMTGDPNRFDVVNVTTGFHAQLSGATALRTAAVFPVTDHRNRFFDAELQVQLNRRF